MLLSFFRHPKLISYKNKLFNEWVVRCKSLCTDYINVGLTTYKECVTHPMKSSLAFAAVWGVYYLKCCNPDELSYRSTVIDGNNRFALVSNLIRNPDAVAYLKMLDKSFSQGLIRYVSCGLFSVIWLDDYDKVVSLYRRQCCYLVTSWLKFPSKVVDVGFLNRWWILDMKMTNYDVNLNEFVKKVNSNVAGYQSLND